jgi:histidinol-phosphate aminotransferase
MFPHPPEYIQALVPYLPGKPISETQREYGLKRVTKLASNENPLGPSPRAVRAMREELRDLHLYPDSAAFELKASLSKVLGVSSEHLLLGNGSNDVIDILVRTFCRPGDSILTPQYAFIAYRICAQVHGVATRMVEVDSEMRADLPGMLQALESDESIRIIFLANPNNPTGTYVSHSALEKFLDGVQQVRGGRTLVVLDYAYWEYVTAKDLSDPMKLYARYPNVIVLRTFSKIYGLAGLRLGYGVLRPELAIHAGKVRQPFNVNSLALVAGVASLQDSAFVRKACKLNQDGLKYLTQELKAMKLSWVPSQGNFLLLKTEESFGVSGTDAYLHALKLGVILRPVANYGLPGALRVSVGTLAENRRAVHALKSLKPVKVLRKS